MIIQQGVDMLLCLLSEEGAQLTPVIRHTASLLDKAVPSHDAPSTVLHCWDDVSVFLDAVLFSYVVLCRLPRYFYCCVESILCLFVIIIFVYYCITDSEPSLS